MEPQIIYEDKDFLAVNKPAGLLVHKVTSGKRQETSEPTLVDWILKNYPEIKGVGDPVKLPNGNYGASDPARPGIVHRLDKETSGVMLVAKDQKTFEYLKDLFKEHKIKKIYLALVWGEPKDRHGIIDKPLGIKSGTIKRTIHSDKMAKEAVTEYRVLKHIEFPRESASSPRQSATLLEVFPKTGRTHQIRVHLASIGHPVVGDTLYGSKTANLKPQTSRLMLHALALEFTAPDGRRMKLEADLPKEFADFI